MKAHHYVSQYKISLKANYKEKFVSENDVIAGKREAEKIELQKKEIKELISLKLP